MKTHARNRRREHSRRRLALLLALAALFLFAFAATARVGGGQSYSGGGSSGGGDGGGELVYLVFRLLLWLTIEHPVIGVPADIVVIVIVVRRIRRNAAAPPSSHSVPVLSLTTASATPRSQQTITALRRFDPNFSEITFGDFCYSLYARAHNARGEGKLDQYAPYLSADASGALATRNPPGLREVRGVVIGSFSVEGLLGIDTPVVQVPVSFESNYTEVVDAPGGGVEKSWYVRERWLLERKRDILSPPPAKAKADHCPHCGAALSTRTDGSCEYCGVRIADGSFQWYVRSVALISRDERGPLLTSDVPEEGTSRETILQPLLDQQRAAFGAARPEFRWDAFDARVRQVATALQNAWSSLQWESVRPLETDGLFQMHRYWIDAYAHQHLRNLVDDYKILRADVVKVKSDAFYEAITVRLWAQGRDHTDAEDGRIVAGSKALRRWSEYWTFVRGHTAGGTEARSCPNCGASMTVGATGICPSCGGKLTTGDFDWILSRIEQDEAYTG
jgi:Tim44-like domain